MRVFLFGLAVAAIATPFASNPVFSANVGIAVDQNRNEPVSTEISCPAGTGFNLRPLVPTKAAAEGIYLSIVRAVMPEKTKRYRKLFVADENDHWRVGLSSSEKNGVQTRELDDKREVITVQSGGGAPEMEIQKCDAEVKITYSR